MILEAISMENVPLTLDKVLLALQNKDYSLGPIGWDLTKPTLEEQSKETQRAIYELMRGEDGKRQFN